MNSVFQADPLILKVPVIFEAGAPVSVLTGGTATVHLRNRAGVLLTGVAAITAAAEITCTFAAWAIPPDEWQIQVRVTVGAYSKTVVPDTMSPTNLPVQITVLKSFLPGP